MFHNIVPVSTSTAESSPQQASAAGECGPFPRCVTLHLEPTGANGNDTIGAQRQTQPYGIYTSPTTSPHTTVITVATAVKSMILLETSGVHLNLKQYHKPRSADPCYEHASKQPARTPGAGGRQGMAISASSPLEIRVQNQVCRLHALTGPAPNVRWRVAHSP